MVDVVSKKIWYFGFSLLVIIPGLVAMALWGLNLGVDFTGGSLTELEFTKPVDRTQLQNTIQAKKIDLASIAASAQNTYLIRTKPLTGAEEKILIDAAEEKFGSVKEISHQTIGPTIGAELLQKALLAILIASLAIVIYIAWAFRRVPKPASSWRFGVSAIVALIHDVIVVVGVFSILGHFWAVEIDALFVTAVLTVIGFSVHDTIVVFDRIRENLNKGVGENFASTVNHSILQTMGRSINTSFTVILVLLPILLFGGSSIRWFTVALLIGIISGTYSSIFNASPLLVAWQEWTEKRRK